MVFEVTGSVQNFAKAVSRIPGLEFVGEEELQADELDNNPEFYLLVPQLSALREIVSLWEEWERTGKVPQNYTPWRDLFLQLRKVRPWGPSDRVSPVNRAYLRESVDGAPDRDLVRLEIELVFRVNTGSAQTAEQEVTTYVQRSGGKIVHRSRHPEFAYHALLVDVEVAEIRRIVDLDPGSLAGVDPVAAIVPQSVGTPIDAADRIQGDIVRPLPEVEEPIAAIFDAAPLQAHPLLADRLEIDDPEDLEARSVGQRVHGTAMASLVLHGDLNDQPSAIRRRVYFRPVMYAPPIGTEVFNDDKLVIDVIVEAVLRMRTGSGRHVIVVNISLGDRTKPFSGRASAWARALDYLSFTYGVLFLISAGNTPDDIVVDGFSDEASFLAANTDDRAHAILRGIDSFKANRRLLAPADSLNSITIGAWYQDSIREEFRGTSLFQPYDQQQMPNISSRLGPGIRRSTKPDVLFAGGRQRARLKPLSVPPVVISHPHPTRYWGLKVAAPSEDGANEVHFTIGSSAATALATHSAHRIFDALEDAYPQMVDSMPLIQRAALLKALLVHSATWRGSEVFVRSVVDPDKELHHEHWRREVGRHLGYGFVDPEDAIACAGDRATMWATGTLSPEGALLFEVPAPAVLGAKAAAREVRATLAWFTPIRPGHLTYRAVKLKIAALGAEALEVAGVGTTTGQPSNSQSESGTIVHRRWRGAQIGEVSGEATVQIQVQRELDQGEAVDEAISFALAITVEMPGEVQVYEQVRPRILVQPRIPIRV